MSLQITPEILEFVRVVESLIRRAKADGWDQVESVRVPPEMLFDLGLGINDGDRPTILDIPIRLKRPMEDGQLEIRVSRSRSYSAKVGNDA